MENLVKYYSNGSISERYEWNNDKTRTYIIERFDENGLISVRYEWNKAKTLTYLIESFYLNGSISERYEWNNKKTRTYIIESFDENGSLYERYEWNNEKTRTFLIERFDVNGSISERYEWNDEKTETILVERYNEDGVSTYELGKYETIYSVFWINRKDNKLRFYGSFEDKEHAEETFGMTMFDFFEDDEEIDKIFNGTSDKVTYIPIEHTIGLPIEHGLKTLI